MSKITNFVLAAIAEKEPNEYSEFELGTVGNGQGQLIASQTGIKTIAGAKKILTSHAVRHAFIRHQGKKSEEERGQVGITSSDFDFLADILSNPTLIERGDLKNRKRLDVIKLSKQIKGRQYSVLMSIVRSKEGTTLFFNTMFIKK